MTPPTPARIQRPPIWRRGGAWISHATASLIWLGSAMLALVLAGVMAAGLWAATPLALPHVLGWAQHILKNPATGVSPLQFQGARGTLFSGGHIERLTWQASGSTVDIQGLTLQWSPVQLLELAFQRSLALDPWAIESLTLTAERPPQADAKPMRPPSDLRLPWLNAVDVSLHLGEFIQTGEPAVRAGPFQGRYRYEASAGHRLDVDTLHWQEGVYTLQAQVATDHPLGLQLHLQGKVPTPAMTDRPSQPLTVEARATGTLGDPEARIEITASIQPANGPTSAANAPRLSLVAGLQPWAPIPVEHAELVLQNINVAQFWPTGPQTQLDGQWKAGPPNAANPDAGWPLIGQLTNRLPGAWDQGGLPLEELQADLRVNRDQIVVQDLTLRLGRGQLQATGTFEPKATRPWVRGTLMLTELNSRDVWSTLPDATWNAGMQVRPDGSATRWEARMSPSDARDLPSLVASGRWAGETVDVDDVRLDWLGSRLTGQLGSIRTDLQVGASSLQWTAPGLSVQWQGTWPLTFSDTLLQVNARDLQHFQRWSRDALRILDAWFPGANLDVQTTAWQTIDLLGQTSGTLQASPQGEGLEWTSEWAADVTVIQGDTRWEASGEARARGYRSPLHGASEDLIQLEALWIKGGGEHHPLHWRFQLDETLEIQHQADGQLQIGAGQMRVQPIRPRSGVTASRAAFSSEPAEVTWESASWRAGHLTTRGRIDHLAMSWINAWLSSPEQPLGPWAANGIEGDVWMGAEWDVSLPLTAPPAGASPIVPRADWRVQYQRGDWSMTGRVGTESRTVSSGIQSLRLSGQLHGDELTAHASVATTELGQVQGHLQTRVTSPTGEAGWQWPASAPLGGEVRMQWSQLDWLAPFLPPGWRVKGAFSGQIQLSGDRSAPQLEGRIHLQDLAVRSLVDGIDLSGGELIAQLQGQQMVIERLHLQGAGGADGGTLSGEGRMNWRALTAGGWQPELDLVFQASEWRVLSRADRRLILSGNLRAQLNDALLDLTGRFQAQQALFLLPDEATPTLGSDVVIRGGSMPVPLHAQLPFQTRVNVSLDLGNRFEIRGLGLQTTLEGLLQIEARPGQLTPSLSGDIRTVRGTYRAYGQRLDIERGLIRFNGPYDNPALDILAVRPHPTQKVGVEISGNAQAPRVRLYADPDLPDSEKLAWLILGRPASGAGAEAAVLQQAALALLSGQGGQRDGSFAQNLGLDELSFQGQAMNPDGTTTAAALTLGKRISDQLYVSYSRSVTGASGTVAMFLDLSRFITLRAQAGDDNAVDIIFSREFDRWRAPRTIPPASP